MIRHYCDNCGKFMVKSIIIQQEMGKFSSWFNANEPFIDGEYCSFSCVIARASDAQRVLELMAIAGPYGDKDREAFNEATTAIKDFWREP